MKAQSPIAVVIGQGGYNDIGLIRSCGEAGLKVVLVTPSDIIVPLNKSRYVVKWIENNISTEYELLDIINHVTQKFNRDIIIFPASDKAAWFLDRCNDSFPKNVIVPNANGKLSTLMDKSMMVEIAEKCGLKVPFSKKLNIENISEFIPPVLPCIIKPLRSIAGEKEDITICKDETDYMDALQKYSSKGFYDILVQSLIEGKNQEEVAVTGVSLPNGEIITKGIIHKKRIRGNGSTVFATFVPEINNELKLKVQEFIKETGFTGIFDMEFLKNENGFHFIECNFRNGAYGYAITTAGFNMPYYFYLGSKGLPLPQEKVRQITFMEERSDILNVLERKISLREWINDILQTNTFIWWNWRDPKPFFFHNLKKVSSLFSFNRKNR